MAAGLQAQSGAAGESFGLSPMMGKRTQWEREQSMVAELLAAVFSVKDTKAPGGRLARLALTEPGRARSGVPPCRATGLAALARAIPGANDAEQAFGPVWDRLRQVRGTKRPSGCCRSLVGVSPGEARTVTVPELEA